MKKTIIALGIALAIICGIVIGFVTLNRSETNETIEIIETEYLSDEELITEMFSEIMGIELTGVYTRGLEFHDGDIWVDYLAFVDDEPRYDGCVRVSYLETFND